MRVVIASRIAFCYSMPMGWLFNRRRRIETELIDALLKAEIERRKLNVETENRQRDIELRKMDLEYEHLEQVHEERRKDAAEREKLRQQRQEWARKAREVRNQKLRERAGVASNGGCRVCANGGDATLTATEIAWHHAGHRQQAQ
jgi:hypothetical protein